MRGRFEEARQALRPPAWAAWTVILSAAVLLTLCLDGTIALPAVSYFAYLYSTYALAVFCSRTHDLIRRERGLFPSLVDAVAARSPALRPVKRFVTDVEYRTRLLLVPSLVFNLGFAVLKLAMGARYRSHWLMGIGLYYALLSAMRFSLLRRLLARKRGEGQAADDWQVYRRTAARMLALTLVMTGLVAQMVWRNRAYNYPGVMIYAFATYAFVKIGVATAALIRHRRGENCVLTASRCLSFACALMSILALQTAMIQQFGGGVAFARTTNALTGAAVCLTMLAMCAAMLLRGRRRGVAA